MEPSHRTDTGVSPRAIISTTVEGSHLKKMTVKGFEPSFSGGAIHRESFPTARATALVLAHELHEP